ncbi:MAG: MFS transporter [Calditrichia bacterium]
MKERSGLIKDSSTILIAAGALIIIISMGTRQTFGLFLPALTEHLTGEREVFSLAMAIQNIVVGIPIAGILADRYGPRSVLIVSGMLYVAAMCFMGLVDSPTNLYFSLGIVAGVALSGASYVVVLGAVAQVVSAERRGAAFGLITASGSLGMFLIVPGAQALLDSINWSETFFWLAGFTALIIPLSFGLPNRPGALSSDNSPQTLPFAQLVSFVFCQRGYLLLTIGFFVCGFHVAFIATHLPAYLSDHSVSSMTGATALSFIGLFNIGGSYFFGWLGDRLSKTRLLSLIYFLRAVVILSFIAVPLNDITALVFGGAIGFIWLATVPLTSGTVAHLFGTRYLSTLYGMVFLSHQVGGFLGVWLGGRVYDATGSYDAVWVGAAVLSIISMVLHLPIREKHIALPVN